MSSNPGGSGVVEHLKKRNARRTTFLLGGRSRAGNALGSIPAKCCGGTSGWAHTYVACPWITWIPSSFSRYGNDGLVETRMADCSEEWLDNALFIWALIALFQGLLIMDNENPAARLILLTPREHLCTHTNLLTGLAQWWLKPA